MADTQVAGQAGSPAAAVQQQESGPLAVEEAALSWLESALQQQAFVRDRNPSRENSLAITKLEEGLFWANQDLKAKIAQLEQPVEGQAAAPAPAPSGEEAAQRQQAAEAREAQQQAQAQPTPAEPQQASDIPPQQSVVEQQQQAAQQGQEAVQQQQPPGPPIPPAQG